MLQPDSNEGQVLDSHSLLNECIEKEERPIKTQIQDQRVLGVGEGEDTGRPKIDSDHPLPLLLRYATKELKTLFSSARYMLYDSECSLEGFNRYIILRRSKVYVHDIS